MKQGTNIAKLMIPETISSYFEATICSYIEAVSNAIYDFIFTDGAISPKCPASYTHFITCGTIEGLKALEHILCNMIPSLKATNVNIAAKYSKLFQG